MVRAEPAARDMHARARAQYVYTQILGRFYG